MTATPKLVALLSPYRLHSFYSSLILFPPPGYRIVDAAAADGWSSPTRNLPVTFVRRFASPVLSKAGLPIKLMSSLGQKMSRIGDNFSLVYSAGMLYFGKKPYITDAEDALSSWMGRTYDMRFLHRFIEQQLGSSHCRSIICWNIATSKSILQTYDTSSFHHKIKVMPPAIPLSIELGKRGKETVDILFLGSGSLNTVDAFYYKGGHIVVEVYKRIKRRRANVRLVMRSKIPTEYKRRIMSEKDIRVIDAPVARDELERTMWNSDIMILPALFTPWTSILEAFDHRLPVVTTNTHANAELVEHGKSGFVCDVPDEMRNVSGTYLVPDRKSKRSIEKVWLNGMDASIEALADSTLKLVDDDGLRQKMGNYARNNIAEGGRFSIQNRNRRLAAVLDEAVSK